MIGLDDLGDLFQPQWSCDSILFITVLISLADFLNLLDTVKLYTRYICDMVSLTNTQIYLICSFTSVWDKFSGSVWSLCHLSHYWFLLWTWVYHCWGCLPNKTVEHADRSSDQTTLLKGIEILKGIWKITYKVCLRSHFLVLLFISQVSK